MLKHCMFKKLLSSFALVILLSFIADSSWAYNINIHKNHTLRIHGFLSQSYLKSNHNNIFGDSDDVNGSLEYNEIGINFSYSPHPKINMASQFLSRRAGETDDGSIKLDFALIDYRFLQRTKYNIGTRFGRIKNPFGFYNDTRDVSFTRESIIIPQSIYFDRTRDLSISSNGMELYMQRNFALGSTTIQFVAAQPRVKDKNTELALFQQDLPGSLNDDTSFITRIIFDLYSGTFKVAYSNIQLNMFYEPNIGAAGELPLTNNANIYFQSNIFSLSYTYNKNTFITEYALRTREVPDLNVDTTGYSYYLQYTRHFNHRWNAFIRYDVLYEDRDDKSGKEYASQITATGPAHSRFAKDVTVGAQFKYSKQWMFRLEAHSVNGTAWLPLRDNPDLFDTKQHWRLISLLVAFRF